MKLTAELEGRQHQLEIRREGTRISAVVDGHSYDLEARASEGGSVYLLLAGGRVFECRLDQSNAASGRSEVHVGGRSYAVTLTDPKRLRGAQAGGTHADGKAAQIIAQMPGKVVRVLVEEGTRVEAGDGVLVVEAMKMQNEMKSPRGGTVTSLRVAAGATVNSGDVLAVIE